MSQSLNGGRPPSIVLIDGPDGVGKTTYAHWMADHLDAVYLHRSRPDPDTNWIDEHWLPVLRYLATGRSVVMDRGPIGNPIWAELFHDGDQALFSSDNEYLACLTLFAQMGAVMHVITRDPVDLAATLTERGEGPDAVAVAVASVPMFEQRARALALAGLPCVLLESDDVHRLVEFGEMEENR